MPLMKQDEKGHVAIAPGTPGEWGALLGQLGKA